MMKTRGAALHVGSAAFSPPLQQYALRLLAALRQLRRWRERDAAGRLLLQRARAQPAPPDSFSKRKQLRCCGFRGGGHGRGLLMLSTAAASCCLLLSSTSTLALASLSAPAAAAATCSRPTGGALLLHVSNHSRRVGAVFSGRRRRRREEEARLRLAGRGGVIAGRRYCAGMQQRRHCCS